MKVRAAVEAARAANILVLARTDARAVTGFDEALGRCRDFADEGVDIVFLEAPQSAEELAPTQLCASRGIWCVNCEDGVGASDQLLRIVDARADVGVRPRREQSTRTRVAFHQNIDSTGRCTLAGITATGVSPGAVLEGVDCDRQYRRAPQLSLCSAWPCDTFASGCSLPAALHVFNARKVAVKPQGSE